jgi:hypothetical protein
MKAPLLPSTATTLAAKDSLIGKLDGTYYHTLFLEWTPGVTGNILLVKVFTRKDANGQWTQEMDWTNTSGTYTRVVAQLSHTAASTTVVPLRYHFTGQGEDVYFTYSEDSTGGASKGTLVGTLFSTEA